MKDPLWSNVRSFATRPNENKCATSSHFGGLHRPQRPSSPCSTHLVPPKSKRLLLAIPCKSILYACMLCTLSIALQGQIRLQAASSHATCSLVRLRKSIFGFWVSFAI